MSSRASNRSNTKVDILQKRIPKNPKYDDVEAVVDTGSSLSRQQKRVEEIKKNFRIRNDELFKRMKVTTFIQLMIQVAEINAVERDAAMNDGGGDQSAGLESELSGSDDTERAEEGETTEREAENGENGGHQELDLDTERTEKDETLSELMTTRSTLEGITRGVGEFDVVTGAVTSAAPLPPGVDESRPYLLLDVRDTDDFNECHLVTAQSFPKAMLNRSANYETKEMLSYRNQPGKIIVIYDEDERLAPTAATTLVERGYNNLFMLSGGMKVAYKYFPNGLLTGTIPASIVSPPKNNNKKARAPPATPIRPEFTMNDLFLLNQQLDDALDDKTQSSRLSRATTEATRSRIGTQMSSRSTTSTVTSKRPAFR